MRDAWARPFLLSAALVATAGAVGSIWAPWLGVERGECGWTCYVPLTPKTASLSFESLGGPAGRFVAPLGVGLALAASVLAVVCVVVAGRAAPRRLVGALVGAVLVAAVGAVAVSVVSVVGLLDHDLVTFRTAGPATDAASGRVGFGMVLALACVLSTGPSRSDGASGPGRPGRSPGDGAPS